MDLKTFVAESLAQIAAGIRTAQEAETGAFICPQVVVQPGIQIVDGGGGKRTLFPLILP